jgi:cell division protein FtsZ
VQGIMEELAGHIGPETQLLFGAAVDAKLEGRVGVTLISSLGARVPSSGEATPVRPPPISRPAPVPVAAPAAPAYTESAPAARAAAEASAPEPTVRGRFDKSEPTIVDGEDLDVPTFMRKNMKVK